MNKEQLLEYIPPESAFKMTDSALPCLPGHQPSDAWDRFIELAVKQPIAVIDTGHSCSPDKQRK